MTKRGETTMTNEQYSNMMIAFAKLEAKIENLQAAFSELLEAPVIENKLAVTGDIKPEHLSNFWNEATIRQFGQPLRLNPDIVENEK